MENEFLNFRLNIMDSENGTVAKMDQQKQHELHPGQENAPPAAPLSPELTSTQKYACQTLSKTSQQILHQIYYLLESNETLKRKDSVKSVKSLQKKESTSNFKCKCKKTKCLKMYCECFAVGKLCNGCNCCDCQNLLQFQQERALAIDEAFQRDPDIFQPSSTAKKGGCICKKTECLKKYCECFSSGVACTSECKCQNCANTNSQ